MRLIAPFVLTLLALGLLVLTHRAALGPIGDVQGYLDLGAQICLWLAAAWLATRLLSYALHRYSAWRARTGHTAHFLVGGRHLLTDVIGFVIFLGALFGIVGMVLHQPIGGLLATSGLFAAIIGFAIQRMIADVFSGLALTAERPFSVGDWIETGAGFTGKITEANWRAVHLETIEGRTVVVPNSVLASDRFVNFNTPQRHFRLKHTICLDYGVPGERVVPILNAAIEATEGIRKDPRPIILIDDLSERGVIYSLNFWVSDYPEQFAISRQLMITALRFLDQAGFAPAYPKRDITVSDATPRQIQRRVDLPGVLRRVPILALLEAELIQSLAASARLHEFASGGFVVHEGDPGASLFIVVTGILDVVVKDGSGGDRPIARLQPGEVFGEMSLLTGAPRSATVVAASPVTLVEIGKSDLESIFQAQPTLIGQLADLEADRLLSNRDALRLSLAENVEIEEVGITNFLRRKIARFFGSPGTLSGSGSTHPDETARTG